MFMYMILYILCSLRMYSVCLYFSHSCFRFVHWHIALSHVYMFMAKGK